MELSTTESFSNIPAETGLLSAILGNTVKAGEVPCRAEDFFDATNRTVFETALKLEEKGKIPDLASIYEENNELFEKLVEIGADGFSRDIAMQNATIISKCSRRRKAASLFQDAMRDLSSGKDASTVIGSLKEAADKIDAGEDISDLHNMQDIAKEEIRRIRSGEKIQCVSTGIVKLDAILGGGFEPSAMVVVGARPSVGKSAFLSHLAIQASGNAGLHILYVSLEMTEQQNVRRMLANAANVPMSRMTLFKDAMRESDIQALDDAYKAYHFENIHQLTGSFCRVSDIRRTALKLIAQKKLDMICVDYLTLLSPEKDTGSRVNDVGQISRSLKALAQEIRVPVITAAQLSRASVNNEDRPPDLTSLRESGSIEQDANVVLFLHEPKRDDRTQELARRNIRPLKLIVAKNRQGDSRGMFPLMMRTDVMSFVLEDEI